VNGTVVSSNVACCFSTSSTVFSSVIALFIVNENAWT